MATGEKRAVLMAEPSAPAGNIPIFSENGQLQGSGKQPGDFAPAPLGEDLTLYVDAASGSDDNDGRSQTQALFTLRAAMGRVPTNLGQHSVTINIAGTFYEQLQIVGYFCGSIQILGSGTSSIANGVLVNLCTASITIREINISGNVYGMSVYIGDCVSVAINRCNIDGANATSKIGISQTGGMLCVLFGSVNNCARAISVDSGVASVYNTTGTGNEIGLQAGSLASGKAGIILSFSTSLGASTATAKVAGGIIFTEGAAV